MSQVEEFSSSNYAAVYWKEKDASGISSNTRIYFQGSDCYIYESGYKTNHGYRDLVKLFPARGGSPLSAVIIPRVDPNDASQTVQEIRVYVLDDNNYIREYIGTENGNWNDGGVVPASPPTVGTSFSAVSARHSPGKEEYWNIYFFYQRADMVVQELVYTENPAVTSNRWSDGVEWVHWATVTGTGIAAAAYETETAPTVHVYFQIMAGNQRLQLCESIRTDKGWALNTGGPKITFVSDTNLAAVMWRDWEKPSSGWQHIVRVRIYYRSEESGIIQELDFNSDTKWLEPKTLNEEATADPGSPIVALHWQWTNNNQYRILFQGGTAPGKISQLACGGTEWKVNSLDF